MTTDNRNDLGKRLKQQRIVRGLTLREISAMSGVSSSHLGRIERGERFPSAHILRKIAKPLGFAESELFSRAGFLSPITKSQEEYNVGQLDPYVVAVLSQESVEIQRTIIGILAILKSIAKGNACNIGFTEYAHRKYPELDEDVITMIENIMKHPLGRRSEKSMDQSLGDTSS